MIGIHFPAVTSTARGVAGLTNGPSAEAAGSCVRCAPLCCCADAPPGRRRRRPTPNSNDVRLFH